MVPDFLRGTDFAQLPTPKIICGVYFLMLGDECVYVGQSVSICSRVVEHITKYPFDSVYFIEVPPGHLDRVERQYIRKLRPKHNLQHNEDNMAKKVEARKRRKSDFLAACIACQEPCINELDIPHAQRMWLFNRGILTIGQLSNHRLGALYAKQIEYWTTRKAMRSRHGEE